MTELTRWDPGNPGRVRTITGLAMTALMVLLAATAGLRVAQRHSQLPAHSRTPNGTSPGLFPAGPVAAPISGVLVGAWTPPEHPTQTGRMSAVDDLQRALGRPLDIINIYRGLTQDFPTSSDHAFAAGGGTLMVSWAIDDIRGIASGAEDDAIRDWARRIRAFRYPILLRFRWSMDQVTWAPGDYVAAWQRVRAIFAEQRVTNVSWVWCPSAAGFTDGTAGAYYPGDDQVDWLCVDIYAGHRLTPLADLVRPFLRWAAGHAKPIVIGEFGVARSWGEPLRAQWLTDAAATFRAHRQIKAVCYFNANPAGNPPSQQFRLAPGQPALKAFASWAATPYFNVSGRGYP